MKEERDLEFRRFIQKHAAVLSAPLENSALHLEIVWDFLVYILELNYLCLYESDENARFHPVYEVARGLKKKMLPEHELLEMMQCAHALRQPKSIQNETAMDAGLFFVQAYAAIPLLVAKKRQLLVICKQLELPKEEVQRDYVFNSYELERHIAVIKNFVRVPEQQKQIASDRKKIGLGKMAVVFGGVITLFQGLDSAVSIIRGCTFNELVLSLGTIAMLGFFVVAIFRLWRADEPFGLP